MSVVALAPEVADATKKRYELMEPFLVTVKDLVVPTYQRETDLGWCQKAAGEFDPNLFLPIVIERGKGSKWHVNQGCHRVEIARILGILEVWACAAKTDKPGELFVDAQQKQRALTAFQQHHALRVDRVAQALRVDSLLRDYELRVASTNQSPGTVNGITMFYRLLFGTQAKIGRVRAGVESHETELRRGLRAIHESWGPAKPDTKSRGSVMIEGLTELFVAHPSADDARVREILAARAPHAIDSIASDQRKSGRVGHKSNFVAQIILEDYNKGLAARERLALDAVRSLW